MGLSKNITLTIKDYEIRLDKQIKFYEDDTIDLCFSILEYGIEVKDGVSINKLMPIQALTAYMLIETPQGVDYAESTKIEDNKIVFKLGSKYSQFVGIGHMQIVIKDSDGCRVTLPEFEFEIKKSINSDWEKEIYFLATEDDSIIIDEFGRKIHMTKISDMPESENLSEESYTMIIDEEGNKRLKVKAIVDAVEDSLDTKFNAYTDEISGEVERIKSEINELKEGNVNIDLTNYATKTELSLKVDKVTGKSLISDSEIERLSTLKNYDDTDVKNTLSSKADKSELHSHNNKSVLDGITSSKVTEWNNKSTFDGNYNSLTNKPTIPTLNGYATEQYVDEEIKKIDVTEQLTDYAKKSELHSHSNKSVLDGITSTKVTEWDSKSTFSGNYNSLTNKPTIPTKTSQLTNDSGFITSIPSEYVTETELSSKGYLTSHQDISGKADKSTLTAHTSDTTSHITATERNTWNAKSNLALGTTSSTAYRGDYGNTAYTHSQSAHAPSNAQKNSDITKAEIEAKLTGEVTSHAHSQYASKSDITDMSSYESLTLGVHSDGLIYIFKSGAPMGGGISQTVFNGSTETNPDLDYDVVGYVDTNKNIVLNGQLTAGDYRLSYEMEDGQLIEIGTLSISDQSIVVPPEFNNLINKLSSEYKLNKRINSSGVEVAVTNGQEDCVMTNLIDVSDLLTDLNSRIVVRGIEFWHNNASGNQYWRYHFYDENKTRVGEFSFVTSYVNAQTYGLRCADNTVVSRYFGNLKNNGNIPKMHYVSYSGEITNGEDYVSAIKNECYGGTALPHTNLANKDEFVINSRLNSSSVTTAQEGEVITNFVPCKKGDIIRIKGLRLSDFVVATETTRYVYEYNSSKQKLEGIELYAELRSLESKAKYYGANDILEYYVRNDSTAYIRTSGLMPSNLDDVVITVNEDILYYDAGDYNVAGKEVSPTVSSWGWSIDKHINSSGALADASGYSISSYFPLIHNRFLKVENFNVDNDYGRFYFYIDGVYNTDMNANDETALALYESINKTGFIINTEKLFERLQTTIGSSNVLGNVMLKLGGALVGDMGDVTITQTITGAYTNIMDIVGYTNGFRMSTSEVGVEKASTSHTVTDIIDLSAYPTNCIIRTSGVRFDDEYACFTAYRSDGTCKNAWLVSGVKGNINTSIKNVSTDSLGNLTMTLDYETLGITGIRLCGLGDGANLIVTINEVIPTIKELTYTNVLPTSLASDLLTPYVEGVGYKTGTRWSASGKAESTASNMCITGYIPYDNQLVRIANATVSGSDTAYLVFFNQSGTVIDAYVPEVYSGINKNGTNFFALNGKGYFRVSYGKFTENTIITLDEPIYANEADYTNVLKTAIDESGNVLDGKGWKANTKFDKNSKTFISASGIYTTGFIKCNKNAFICMKGIDFDSTDHLIFVYDKDLNEVLGTYLTSHFYSKHNGINYSKTKLRHYTALANYDDNYEFNVVIRGKSISTDAIITINEPI